MLTKDDLEAISNIIDQKLDQKLQPIVEDISELKKDMQDVKENLSDIKEDIRDINDAIGIISEWAEKVADKERIPFASGN
jgi:archaellum component FlaC